MSSSLPAGDGLMRELIREVLRESVREEVQRVLADLGPLSAKTVPARQLAAGTATATATRSIPTAGTAPGSGAARIERGPLTERMVDAARGTGEIRVARGVAITPLAKDRARALGVQIIREP